MLLRASILVVLFASVVAQLQRQHRRRHGMPTAAPLLDPPKVACGASTSSVPEIGMRFCTGLEPESVCKCEVGNEEMTVLNCKKETLVDEIFGMVQTLDTAYVAIAEQGFEPGIADFSHNAIDSLEKVT